MSELAADECVFKTTVEFLRRHGYKIITAQEQGLTGKSNSQLLKKAMLSQKILITSDLEFGNILVYPLSKYAGIIVLKITKENEDKVHANLLRMLTEIPKHKIRHRLVIINHNKYRIRG